MDKYNPDNINLHDRVMLVNPDNSVKQAHHKGICGTVTWISHNKRLVSVGFDCGHNDGDWYARRYIKIKFSKQDMEFVYGEKTCTY